MAGKIEIKTTSNGKFMFNLKATNGQIILTSNVFGTKEDAMAAIAKLQALKEGDIEVKTNAAGEPYFSIAGIGKGESYSSKAACDNGVESVKKNAPTATIVEA
ncbi:MAG: YegP family protein [Anaerolineae bacterium]|nr:YegP family protein [Anaerolineae bacterium]